MTYSIIEKSSNKLMIGKTYWKNVAIPSILYGSSVVNFSDTDIEKLQRIENVVYRQILGAQDMLPTVHLEEKSEHR